MAVRKGEPWGEPAPMPKGAPIFDDDRSLGRWIAERYRPDDSLEPIGLAGGDLARTLGGGARARVAPDTTARFPVDLVQVLADGVAYWSVAHVVIRRRWFTGPLVAAMNAAFVGPWNVAPRAHPGDGKFDVVTADLTLRERLQARNRLASGSHVPHPGIEIRRRTEHLWESARPEPVWIDGELVAKARHVQLRLDASALHVHL